MIVTKDNPHQCPNDMLKNELALEFEKLKSMVRTSDQPVTKIFEAGEDAWCDKGNNLVAPFPKFENAKHSLYDARNKFAGVTKMNFKSFDEVQVPVQHSDFVLVEYKDEDKMILRKVEERKVKEK
uniref:Uncharacterized protein n=1 Tax=Pectinophora gossypiella TaxID=13191 RepID=A0A1E1VXW6_PECGO